MKLDLFGFELPENLIANHPIEPRDSARLLYICPDQQQTQFLDWHIWDLPSHLSEGDVLVVNNTRVLPVQLSGKRDEIAISLILHKSVILPSGEIAWRAFARPGKRLKIGQIIVISQNFQADVAAKYPQGDILLTFPAEDHSSFLAKLKKYGKMPLPPYMRRVGNRQDEQDYQTVFAKYDGAVAAPTAGLHFTPKLRQKLIAKGIEIAEVTLHVGAGTFLPVKVEDTDDHLMHREWFELSAETVKKLDRARQTNHRIVAVGTTSLRVLESAHPQNRHILSECHFPEDAHVLGASGLYPLQAETELFITPGYRFAVVDILLTNFHLPKSTLFMLVSAFAGLETMQSAYQYAISQRYRFFSYGDACLIYPEQKYD